MKRKKKVKPKTVFQPKQKGNFITIKTSLKSILKDYENNFQKINEIVLECNEIVIQTYQFIRLYLLDCYYKNKDFPELDKDTILYFIRAGGIRDNRGKQAQNKEFQKELEDFYDKEFKPLIQKEKYSLKNKTFLTPYLATQINTSFTNNIKEHFITRVRRFMNIFSPFPLETKEQKEEFQKIKNLILFDKLDEIPNNYKEWSRRIRNNFLPSTYEKAFGYDCKVNPNKYLFYTIKMNEEIEKKNDEIRNSNKSQEEKRKQIKKLFQPIPLRNIIVPNYITFDANSILSLFGEKGESQKGKKVKDNKEFIWSKIFRTGSKVMNMKGYEYKTIHTDGIGVSICFQKIGNKTKENPSFCEIDELYLTDLIEEDLEKCKNRKIIGIDPGKQSLVYMVDENKKKLRYTVCQRRVESYRKKNSMILQWEKLNNNIIEEETKLSLQNSKSVNYEKFKNFIKEKNELNEKLKKFYNQELHRKLKWRSWIYQRKSEDKFLNRIEETYGKKEDILLCYGNWSNTSQMKYIMPTKGVGLRRVISKKYDVVLLDEFKTSALCSKCNKELDNYKNIHRLLVCKNCGLENKNSVFINRDMNACINMVNLSKEWINSKKRNENFCRNTNTNLNKEGE